MHRGFCSVFLAGAMAVPSALAAADSDPILPELSQSKLLVVSTVPSNGDLNPYGVAFVQESFPGGGAAAGGDILVSNFNNSANLQGTGSTIVQMRPPPVPEQVPAAAVAPPPRLHPPHPWCREPTRPPR